jgi:hypothetical protein
MGTGVVSHGLKRPAREGDHSPPSIAELMNSWSYTSTSHAYDNIIFCFISKLICQCLRVYNAEWLQSEYSLEKMWKEAVVA